MKIKKNFLIILSFLFVFNMVYSMGFAQSMEEYHGAIMKAFNRQNIKEIKRLSDKAIEDYPNWGAGYFFKALALDCMGEYEKAIIYYTKSMEFPPIYTDHYQNRGLAYLHNKQYDKAIADYNIALKLDPTNKAAEEQRDYALFARNGIIMTTQGNVTNLQYIHDPFYLAEQYFVMPKDEKDKYIKSVTTYSAEALPIYYIAVSQDIFPKNKNLASFLYLAGYYRSIQDVCVCKDKSAQKALIGFKYVAPDTAEYIAKMSDEKLAKLMQRVLDWDKQYPQRPNPEWICYHGMEVLSNGGKIRKTSKIRYYFRKINVSKSFIKNIEGL